MIRTKIQLIAFLLLSLSSHAASAEVAIIVHPSNNDHIDDKMIKSMFLGKSKTFSNGAVIKAFNQEDGNITRDEFEQKVLNKSQAQIKAYWSKLVFTGKGIPPEKVNSDQEMVQVVASEAHAIGYVDADSVTDSVRIIKIF